MQKKLLIPVLLIAFLAGTFTLSSVSAQTEPVRPASLLDNLVARFALNPDEVQSVIEQTRDEQRTIWQSHYEEWLDSQVQAGNLTSQQKQLILDKKAQLRQEAKQKRAELRQWAQENDVELKYLFGPRFLHPWHHRYMEKVMHFGEVN